MSSMSSMSSIDRQKIQKSDITNTINAINNVPFDNIDSNQQSKTTFDRKSNRKRRNTVRILMDVTMQFLSSPPTSPPSMNCSSPSSINSNESSYFSFPEFEIYDEMNNNNHNDDQDVIQREVDNMVVQMERFDEMFVNGVRVPLKQI